MGVPLGEIHPEYTHRLWNPQPAGSKQPLPGAKPCRGMAYYEREARPLPGTG